MIDFKNTKELSNAELSLYLRELLDSYEVLKNEISRKCNELETIDREYAKAQNELKIRQTKIF